jgi:predicted acyl esterase
VPSEWITLSDGCRLSARIWMPGDALRRPVPAVLEYIPYRKDDAIAARDGAMQGDGP